MNKSFSHYTTRLADSKDHSLDEQTKERMAREWIEAALHHELPTLDLYTSLRDGVILCKVMNCLHSNSIPDIGLEGTLSKMKNIHQFLQAGQQLGMNPVDLFQVNDLAQGRNMKAVVHTILSLAHLHSQASPFTKVDRVETDKQRTNSSLPRPETNTARSSNKSHHGHPRGSALSHSDAEPQSESHLPSTTGSSSLPLNRKEMSFKESTNLPKPRRPSFSRKQLEGVFPINKAKEMSFKESTNPPKPRIYSFHTQQLEELLPANGKDNYTKDALNCPEDADTNLDNSYTLFTMMKCPPQEHQHYSTTTGLGYDSPDLDTSHTMDLLFANDYQFTTTPSDKFMLEHMSTHALQYDSSDSELCYSPTAALDTVYESENAHPSVQSLPQNSLPSMPSHLSSLFQLGSTKVLYSMEKEKRENEPTATSPPEPSISTSPEMASYLETEHTLSNENPIDNSSHQNSTVRSQMSSASSTSTASRLSRLSQLSFAKKLPSRNNIPFHMRYQEWTDQKMKKEQEEPLSLSHSLPNSLPEQASLYQFPVARRERIELPLPTDLPLVKEHPILKTKLASKKAIFSVKPNGSLSSPLLKSGRPASKTQTLPPISRGGDKTPPTQLRSSRVSPLTKDGSGKLTHNSANGVSGGVSGAKKQPPQSPDILPLPPLHHSPPKEEISLPRRKSTGNLALHGTLEGVEDCLQLQDATGYTVARYKLGNSIGKGHFGTVHRALDLRTGQMVAVKRIKLNVTRKEDVNDVLQEAQLLQSLTHPNIVMYKGFIQTHHHIHIVLEYVENGSLLSTLKAFKSFPEALVAGYCQRILEGLTYLHAQDVVHCDLKAANILTTKAGDVKLSDFGVSLNLKLKETQAGVVAGTPNWMAPEVIELKGATTKSDIWSLGCTIIELCTGKPPYADVNPMTALFRIVEDDRPPLPDSISKELEHFLGLCFQKSPQDRPTADELSNHPWIFNNCHNDKTKKMAIPASMVKQVVEQAAIDIPTHAASDTMERPSMVPSSFPTLSREGSFPFVEPSLSQSTPTLLSQLPPMVPSILVKKYEKRLADQQNEKNIERKHHFVKGSFAKAAIRCKSCQLPIKQKALVCEECGFICHDKCKPDSLCHAPLANPQLPDYKVDKPEDTSQLNKSMHRIKEADKTRPTSEPPKPKRNTFGSKPSFSSLPPQSSTLRSLQEVDPKPRPSSSVSTQLRQRTQKFTCAFSSVVHSNPTLANKPRNARSHEEFIVQDTHLPLHTLSSTLRKENEARESMVHRRKTRRGSDKRPSNPEDCIIS